MKVTIRIPGRLQRLIDKAGGLKKFILLLIIFLIPVIASATLYINNSPSANKFCTVCHNMEPYYNAIEQSGHRELNCHKCHPLTPEVIVKEPLAQLLENPSAAEIKEKFSPEISMYSECIKCHSPDKLEKLQIHEVHLGLVEVTGSCDICHDIHAPSDLDISCTKCHDEASMIQLHADFHNEALYKLDSGDTSVCNQCHSSTAKWEIPLSPSCTKGGVEGKGCFTCHTSRIDAPDISRRACTECHK